MSPKSEVADLVWCHHYMLWSIPGADTRCCGLMLRSEFGPPFEYRSVCALVWSNLTLFPVSGSGVCSGLYYYNMIRGEICQPLSAFWPHLFLTICCGYLRNLCRSLVFFGKFSSGSRSLLPCDFINKIIIIHSSKNPRSRCSKSISSPLTILSAISGISW